MRLNLKGTVVALVTLTAGLFWSVGGCSSKDSGTTAAPADAGKDAAKGAPTGKTTGTPTAKPTGAAKPTGSAPGTTPTAAAPKATASASAAGAGNPLGDPGELSTDMGAIVADSAGCDGIGEGKGFCTSIDDDDYLVGCVGGKLLALSCNGAWGSSSYAGYCDSEKTECDVIPLSDVAKSDLSFLPVDGLATGSCLTSQEGKGTCLGSYIFGCVSGKAYYFDCAVEYKDLGTTACKNTTGSTTEIGCWAP